MKQEDWREHLATEHGFDPAFLREKDGKALSALHRSKFPDCLCELADRFCQRNKPRWPEISPPFITQRASAIVNGSMECDELDRHLRRYLEQRLKGGPPVKPFDGLRCVYCRSGRNLTEEHVPPQSVFVEEPHNLPVVPACGTCNSRLSKQDDYFRAAITLACSETAGPARKAMRERVLPGLGKPTRKGLAKAIREFTLETRFSATGEKLGEHPAWRLDSETICLSLQKIAIGLYWRHFYKIVETGTTFYYDLDLNFEQAVRLGPVDYDHPKVGDGRIFNYDYSVGTDSSVRWIFTFHCVQSTAVWLYPPGVPLPPVTPKEWGHWKVGGDSGHGRTVFMPNLDRHQGS